jgi:hypothetical protein
LEGLFILSFFFVRGTGPKSPGTPFLLKGSLMNTNQPETLDLKIQVVRLITDQIHDNYTGTEPYAQDVDTLLGVLGNYHCVLVQWSLGVPITLTNLTWIKESVRDAGCLLVDMGHDEPELMAGWYHGIAPTNQALALANLLSRIILELSGCVYDVESQFPSMKAEFDAERTYQAGLIRDQEDLGAERLD